MPIQLNKIIRVLSLFMLEVVLLGTAHILAQEKPNTCLDCHSAMEGSLQVTPEKWANDIHMIKGFGCVDCHGGDPTQMDDKLAMSRAKGFLGAPKGMAIIQVCGKCHSDPSLIKKYNPAERVDQVSEYFTSVHGKRLKQGDTHVATCISCHGVHEIRAVNDPRAKVYPLNVADTCGNCHSDAKLMAPYHLKTDQKDEYMKSVHYEALTKKADLSAPTCNDCHGNHGATPPGINSVALVCGQCHSIFADLFEKSPHKAAFASMNLPSCVHCHGNHDINQPTDAMLGTTPPAVCLECHSAGDPGFKQAETMRKSIDELKTAITRSDAILTEAEHKGMEVSQPVYELIEARQDLTKARTQIHSFDAASVQEFVQAGLKISQKTETKGREALNEYQFRRKGLAVSLIIILAVIVALYFKIREIGRRRDSDT